MNPGIQELESWLPESFARLAEAYFAIGERQKAIQLLKEHAGRYPEYSTGYWLLGKYCFMAGERQESLEYLRRVLQIEPEHPAALELMAKVYEAGGETVLAESYRSQLNRARMYFEEEDQPLPTLKLELKAPAQGDVISREGPQAAAGLFATETMVDLVMQQGHKEIARELCRKILTREPDNNRIRQLMEELES